MIEAIKPKDRDHWLNLRTQDVTSTEVSALFGQSPYLTQYELWHRKKSGDLVEIETTERMEWGLQLEGQIAAYIAEKQGWEIEPMDAYHRDPVHRIGSSFDYLIVGGKTERDLPGLLEIKNVDSLQYRQKWLDDGQGNIEAPGHIELQVQHQMLLAGVTWAAIGVLIGGNSHRVVIREADAAIQAAIKNAAKFFWETIDSNDPPSADYSEDAQLIIDMNAEASDSVIDATKDQEILILSYDKLCKDASKIEKDKKALKAEILQQIGDAGKVMTSFGSVNCSRTKDSEGVLVTPDMVGKRINARKGYRQFKITYNPEA